jgi:methylisocitrate lyase
MTYRELLSARGVIHVGLVSGPAEALAAEDLGFDGLQVGGGVSAMHEYAVQDGLITPGEVIEQVRRVRAVTDMPVMADLDDVGGVPPYVRRYVRAAEDAGASAFVMEDIDCLGRWRWSSTIGGWDYQHQRMREAEAQADLIKAAVDARRNSDTVVIARTDALITQSMDEALRRSELYISAGADMIMIIGIDADSASQAAHLTVPLTGLVDLEEGKYDPEDNERQIASGLRLLIYMKGLGDQYAAAAKGLGQASPLIGAQATAPAESLFSRIGVPEMIHDVPPDK